MKRWLYAAASVAVLTLAAPIAAQAAVITNLGVNPTSATGRFSNDPTNGPLPFFDQYTFQLVGAPAFITFASATNDYAQASDFITSFTGQLFRQVGAVGGGDDIAVSVAAMAMPCQQNPNGCQILATSSLLAAGNYFLQISGIAGSTAGYGGNITTAAVPGPIAGAGLPVLMALGGLVWARRRKATAATA